MFSFRGDSQERRFRIMCGGSPLIVFFGLFLVFVFWFWCRGDSQERRYLIHTLVLPSMNRNSRWFAGVFLWNSCRGDSQGSGVFFNSRSPLCKFWPSLGFKKDVGEIHRGNWFLSILVLPTVISHYPNFRPIQGLDNIHRGRLWLGHAIPYIVYI